MKHQQAAFLDVRDLRFLEFDPDVPMLTTLRSGSCKATNTEKGLHFPAVKHKLKVLDIKFQLLKEMLT